MRRNLRQLPPATPAGSPSLWRGASMRVVAPEAGLRGPSWHVTGSPSGRKVLFRVPSRFAHSSPPKPILSIYLKLTRHTCVHTQQTPAWGHHGPMVVVQCAVMVGCPICLPRRAPACWSARSRRCCGALTCCSTLRGRGPTHYIPQAGGMLDITPRIYSEAAAHQWPPPAGGLQWSMTSIPLTVRASPDT